MSPMSVINFARRSPLTVLMMAIAVGALGLRLWGIWFGLPYLLHNDEGFEVIRALQLGNGDFNFGRISKGGYFYLLFVEYGILFVVLRILGVVGSSNEFAQLFVSDPTLFYLTGRATTAIIGTATVFMVYRIGRLAYSEKAAVFAAALLAVNVLHVALSHNITVDVPMVFLATVSLYFAIKLAQTGGAREYLWAALFAAFATATKLPAIVLVLPLIIAHFFYVIRTGGGTRELLFGRLLWTAAILFVGVYLILAPGLLVNFKVFTAEIMGKFAGNPGAIDGESADSTSTSLTQRDLFSFYIDKIRSGMGWPVFVLSIAGVGYGIWQRNKADLILLSFALVIFIAVSITSDAHHFFPRYILPIIPVMALMGGRLLSVLSARISGDRRTMIEVIVMIALCAIPTYIIAGNNYRMTQPDTRVTAKEWIDSNIPAESTIFIEGTRTRPYNATVPLQNTASNLRDSIKFYQDSEPGKAKYFRLELETLAGSTYDLLLVEFSGLQDLQFYKDAGVQYFVLRPGVRAEVRQQKGWPEFIASVKDDPEIEMVMRFQPDPVTTPGPLIELYRLGSSTLP